jgi:AraC family transcriptional regulator
LIYRVSGDRNMIGAMTRRRSVNHNDGLDESGISAQPIELGTRSGLSLTETRYAPLVLLDTHHHDCATLSLVFQGAYEERVGRRAHACLPFSFVCKPPQVAHSNAIGGTGLHALFVEIAGDRAEEARDAGLFPPDAVCLRSPEAVGLVARVAEELRTRSTAFELSIEGLVLELWAAAARQRATSHERRPPPWLMRAREFVQASFRERITLGDVARAAGVHPVHLAQVYRRRYGHTVGGHVRALRIEFATQALADPALSISRIALDAGFVDHSHFTRAFRSRTGLTPSRYRALLQITSAPNGVQVP